MRNGLDQPSSDKTETRRLTRNSFFLCVASDAKTRISKGRGGRRVSGAWPCVARLSLTNFIKGRKVMAECSGSASSSSIVTNDRGTADDSGGQSIGTGPTVGMTRPILMSFGCFPPLFVLLLAVPSTWDLLIPADCSNNEPAGLRRKNNITNRPRSRGRRRLVALQRD